MVNYNCAQTNQRRLKYNDSAIFYIILLIIFDINFVCGTWILFYIIIEGQRRRGTRENIIYTKLRRR